MRVCLGVMLSLLLINLVASCVNVVQVSSGGKTWVVDDDGSADFVTVQEAVDAASSGDTVYVREGIYYENVVVNKTLSLVGDNRSMTVLDANGTDAVLRIHAEGVSVGGFTVRNSVKPGYGFRDGIRLHSSRNVVHGNVIEDCFNGVYVDKNENNISSNEVRGNFDGIRLESSLKNVVDGNNITFSKYEGVSLLQSNENMIIGNRLRNNHMSSIVLIDSDENSVTDNVISDNGDGIWLDNSWNNTIGGNTITNNRWGLGLRLSGGNKLRDNDLAGNEYNFGVYQYFEYNLSHFMNDIDTSNVVDGKPIYYLVNQHNVRVPDDAGYVAVVNSTNVIAENLNLTKNWQGVLLASARNSIVSGLSVSHNYAGFSVLFSSDVLIVNNTVTRNWDGMIVWQSDGNTIARNNVTLLDGEGIGLWYSSGNFVERNNVVSIGKYGIRSLYGGSNFVGLNNVSNCSRDYPGWGVNLYNSSSNRIFGNNVSGNGSPSWAESGGIFLWYSDDNAISHNNFINNRRQAFCRDSENVWDDGYPSGGNFWSDYVGVDVFKGRFQNVTGSDGVGDSAYVIDEMNRDNYPLIEPWIGPAVLGSLQVLEPGDGFVAVGSLDIVFSVTNLGDPVEFGEGDVYNQIDLEIEFVGQDRGVQLWTTVSDGLSLGSGETFVKTLTYDFSSAGVHGDVNIAVVHWRYDPASEAYYVGEFGECKVVGVLAPLMPSEVAAVDFDPDTLCLRSKGRWITACIEFPQGYDVGDVDVASIVLNATVPMDSEHPANVGDCDGNAAADLLVRFDRAEVIFYILGGVSKTELVEERFGTVTLVVTGRFRDGTLFQAVSAVRVIY